MKLLRILTGTHAGAQLRLAADGKYVVSDAEDADIEITDWTEPPLGLLVTEAGVQLWRPEAADDAPPQQEPLEDLQPRRFGDIVLCVGPADEPWPSDLRLLEDLVRGVRKSAPAGEPAAAPDAPRMALAGGLLARPRARLLLTAGIVAVALLGGFVSLISRGAVPPPLEPLQARVTRALMTTGVVGLSVHKDKDGNVSVDGVVVDDTAATTARSALRPFDSEHVAQRFSVATAVAQSIGDALANPGLAVRYRGDGEYVVSGASQDLDAVRGKLQRIATDLGPALTRVTLAATELPPRETVPTHALLSSPELQYVQTRDGTKHLTLRTPPAEAAIEALPEPAARAASQAPSHARRPRTPAGGRQRGAATRRHRRQRRDPVPA